MRREETTVIKVADRCDNMICGHSPGIAGLPDATRVMVKRTTDSEEETETPRSDSRTMPRESLSKGSNDIECSYLCLS